MKRFVISTIAWLFYVYGVSQVEFVKLDDIPAFFSKAKAENKIIFLQYFSKSCDQCNEVAMEGLKGPLLSGLYGTKFLSAVVDNETLNQKLRDYLHFSIEFGSVFVDPSGQVLLIKGQTTSQSKTYLEWANEAIKMQNSSNSLIEWRAEYLKNNRSPEFLKKYILAQRKIDIYDQKMMEEYVKVLSNHSIAEPENTTFILLQGLSYGSDSYKSLVAATTPRFRDSLWYLMDVNTRIQINNRARKNTYQDAVTRKDIKLMLQLHRITINQYGMNRRDGEKVADRFLCDYYGDVKDTTNFLLTAQRYAENYLLPINVDSIRKKSEERIENQKEELKRTLKDQSFQRVSVSRTTVSNATSDQLISLAKDFLKMTNDEGLLRSALTWSKKAIDIWDATFILPALGNPDYFTTYANLHQKLGNAREYKVWMEKAKDAEKKRLESSQRMEHIEKMKSEK
jgi:hypothetical protein